MSQAIDGCCGSNVSANRGFGRRRVWAAALAAVALCPASLAFALGGEEPEPRVGENPPGCNTNAFNAQISVLGGTCVGNQLTFAITLTNPLNPNDPPFRNCRASNVVVRFWAPGNIPNNFPNICASTNPTITLTPPGGLTMLPPATQTYIGGPGLPELLYTPAAPGLVTAYVCITGVSDTSLVGTLILNERAVDITISTPPPCSITGNASVCAGQTTPWCAPEGAGFTYLWEGSGVAGLTTRCVNVGTAGEYCVTVTDTATGCTTRCCRTLTVNQLPDCTITGLGSICFGQTTQWCAPEGQGLTYLWEGTGVAGLTTRCVTVGTPGEYCVTVTDANGCSKRCCRTLTNFELPLCSITGASAVCVGQTTQWCANEGSGFTYLWEGTGIAGQTTRCVTVGAPGEYCVTITDANGCSSRCCKTLTNNSSPECSISGPASVCTGSTVQWCAPEGATLTYLWEGTGVAGLTTRCVTVGTAGEYCVTITDSSTGCSSRCCRTLTVNQLPPCTITGSSTVCAGKSTQWCAPAGDGLTYVWEGAGVAGLTTRCVTVGTPGEYCVTVTDANGCHQRCCKTLTNGTGPECSISGPASTCTGQTVQWCATDGVGLTYLWEGTGVAGQTTRCVTVGAAGEYCVTITDSASGCNSRCCRTLSVNTLPDCTITGSSTICPNQTTQWCAPEGQGLTYVWEGAGIAGLTTRCVTVGTPGEYCVTVTDANGCSKRCCKTLTSGTGPTCSITGTGSVCVGQTTEWCAPVGSGFTYLWEGAGVAGLTTRCVTVGTPGEYCVTVTDNKGCSSRCCKTLTNGAGPECSISGDSSVCSGQTTQWCATGGSGLTYLWEGPGGASGKTTRCITVGTAGEYCVTITKNGCSSRCCKTLTVKQKPDCTITGSDSVCEGQSTQWCAPEGAGYTYLWEGNGVNGATTRCVTVGEECEYCVTVTKDGCSKKCCKDLKIKKAPECAITGASSVCQGGTTQWCATSGTGLTYLWEGPGVAGQTTRCVNVSAPGEYCVTVTKSGCSTRCCKTLTNTAGPNCTVLGADAVCEGASVQWCAPSGSGFTYLWEGPGVAGATTRCVTVSIGGEYCVTVTKDGCSKRCCKTLVVTPDPNCTILGTDAVCEGTTVQWCAPSGAGYTYLWNGPGVVGSTTRCVSVSAPGDYCVIVTQNGCSSKCCKTLVVSGKPNCEISGEGTVCDGSTTQWCAPGGSNYTYLWNGPGVTGQTTRCVNVGAAGDYCVIVSNNGCSSKCCRTLIVEDCGGNDGCTPCYWKDCRHLGDWPAPYTPQTLFKNACAGNPSKCFENAFNGKALFQVIRQSGTGLNALGRETVAALLNAASPAVDYPLTPEQVIQMFNDVYPGGNYGQLKDLFRQYNSAGCPFCGPSNVAAKPHNECDRCDDAGRSVTESGELMTPTPDSDDCNSNPGGDCGTTGGSALATPLILGTWMISRRRKFRPRIG